MKDRRLEYPAAVSGNGGGGLRRDHSGQQGGVANSRKSRHNGAEVPAGLWESEGAAVWIKKEVERFGYTGKDILQGVPSGIPHGAAAAALPGAGAFSAGRRRSRHFAEGRHKTGTFGNG